MKKANYNIAPRWSRLAVSILYACQGVFIAPSFTELLASDSIRIRFLGSYVTRNAKVVLMKLG